MKILEINYTDVGGGLFNGRSLALALNKNGFDISMMVLTKTGNDSIVCEVNKDIILHHQIKSLERKKSVSHLFYPYGDYIYNSDLYKNADLVHFHILHNSFISLLDYPQLFNDKPSIWTVHDPWIFTGNCVHPLECRKWITGCGKCEKNSEIDDFGIAMDNDNASFMWKVKKRTLSKINPQIIVASKFMADFFEISPMTKHMSQIEIIPFGIDAELYKAGKKDFDSDVITIGFRADNWEIKGCKYLYEALLGIKNTKSIKLKCVGNGNLPKEIMDKFEVENLSWVDSQEMIQFYKDCHIFIMPSLAEGFGLMAVEAMASAAVVVCFENTSVESLVDSPRCGIAAKYRSTKSLKECIEYLLDNRDDLKRRSELCAERVFKEYRFERYVKSHEDLYNRIYKERLEK